MDALDAEGFGFQVTDPNGNQGKDAKEAKEDPDAKPKRVVLRAPKLKAEDLQSKARGIPALLRAFEKVKFGGSEEQDLAKAMRTYRMWAHAMFKFAPFDDLCQKIEKEGNTFTMKEYMQRLREERDDPTLAADREAEENRQDIIIDGDDEAAIADAMRRARTPGKDNGKSKSKPRVPAISMVDDDEEDAPLDMQFEPVEPSQSSKQGGADIDYKMSPSLEQHMPHAQPQRSAAIASAKPARASTLNEDQRARMRANLQRAKRLKAERMRKKRELEAVMSGKNIGADATAPSEEPQAKKARTSEHSTTTSSSSSKESSSSSSSRPSASAKPTDSDSQQSDSAIQPQDNDKSPSSTKSSSREGSKSKRDDVETSEKVDSNNEGDDDMMELSDREEDAVVDAAEGTKDAGGVIRDAAVGAGESAEKDKERDAIESAKEDATSDAEDVSSMSMDASDKPKQYGADEIPPSPPTFSQVSPDTPDDDALSATQVRASLQSQSSSQDVDGDDDAASAMTPTQVLSVPSQVESQGELMPTQVLAESQDTEMSIGGSIDTELAVEMRQGSDVSEGAPDDSA